MSFLHMRKIAHLFGWQMLKHQIPDLNIRRVSEITITGRTPYYERVFKASKLFAIPLGNI